jgi:hypothetical protein
MKRLLLLPFALAGVALCASGAVLPPEKLLPDDTLAVFTIPDFAKATAIYQASPQAQFWSDPALKPFKDKLMDKVKSEFVTPMEHDLGIHFDDYTSLPQGQLTLAVTQNGWQGKEDKLPALLFLLDTKDKSDKLKSNLTDLKKKWVDAGKTVKTEKIRDVEFSIITLSSNDLPKSLQKAMTSSAKKDDADDADKAKDKDKDKGKSEPKAQLYIGQAESLLIIGSAPGAIEKVLAGMAGGSVKTLSDVPSFAANQAAMFHDAPVFGWINTKTLVEVAIKSDDSAPAGDADNPFSFKAEKLFSGIGLKGLKTVAFDYMSSPEGGQANFMLGVPEDGRSGIFKILAGEPKEYAPPAFVPVDVVKFQRWRLDGQKFWAGLQQMLGDINPAILNGLNFMLGTAESSAKEKDPSFDIKKNLFGNLGDDIIIYSKAAKGDTLEALTSPPTLYLIGSPNAEQLAGALRSIMVLVGQQPAATERDFLGHKIYSIPLPPMGQGPARTLSYSTTGGYMAISADAGILEEYMRSSSGDAKSLRDTPGLADAMQKVGGPGTSMFGYSNEADSVRQLLGLLKKDPSSLNNLGPLAQVFDDPKVKDWVDFSLLPTFESISKYFYFSVSSGGSTPDGLVFKVFAPVPPQLKKQ